MATIAYRGDGSYVIVTDLPAINSPVEWRRRKAEANRQLHIRRLQHELQTAQIASHKTVEDGRLPPLYVQGMNQFEGDVFERWLQFANKYFAPSLCRADAEYWIKRDQYVDWWQIAGLSQGAQRDAERAAETWFAGAMSAGD